LAALFPLVPSRVMALSLPDLLYLPGFQKFGRRGDPTAATSCCGFRGAAQEADE